MRRLSPLIVLGLLSAMPVAAKERRETAVKNEALRAELRAMYEEDQRIRTDGVRMLGEKGIDPANPPSPFSDPKLFLSLMGDSLILMEVDYRNGQRMQKVVKVHGWPGKMLVGQDGAKAAWLLVQHQDANLAFQAKCLTLMETAPEGEVEAQDIAYLTDRVLVNRGKKQRYGTQMGANFEPRPLEDPENVDKRRAEVGLMPLDEYLKFAREAYEQMAADREIKIAPGGSPGAK